MVKLKKIFECNNCGHQSSKWTGKCVECNEWNTLSERILSNSKKKSVLNSFKIPQLINDIKGESSERIQINDNEFNRVIGNGLVNGSVILLGGEPGIGKSTLSLKIALTLKLKVLYISGEESNHQIKLRANRLNYQNNQCFIYNETEINTFYIYITLRNLYYSKFTNYNKNKKTVLFSDIDNEKFNYIINEITFDIDVYNDNYKKKVNLEALYNKIDSIIEGWYWYDKKLTKLYLNTDMSMRDISKETKISLSSIFNTLTNAKEKIREESKEEYKKYKS